MCDELHRRQALTRYRLLLQLQAARSLGVQIQWIVIQLVSLDAYYLYAFWSGTPEILTDIG